MSTVWIHMQCVQRQVISTRDTNAQQFKDSDRYGKTRSVRVVDVDPTRSLHQYTRDQVVGVQITQMRGKNEGRRQNVLFDTKHI